MSLVFNDQSILFDKAHIKQYSTSEPNHLNWIHAINIGNEL